MLLPHTSAQDRSRWFYICWCHVYASHRYIVAQVVPRQGHVAKPTCWGLTHVLARIQYAGWGATFLTVHRCYSYNQKVLSTWMHSRYKMTLVSNKHLISIIGVYLKLSLEIMACCDERILLVTFLSGPLRNQHQTATPSLSYINMVWFLQNFKLSQHDFLLNTRFGQLII